MSLRFRATKSWRVRWPAAEFAAICGGDLASPRGDLFLRLLYSGNQIVGDRLYKRFRITEFRHSLPNPGGEAGLFVNIQLGAIDELSSFVRHGLIELIGAIANVFRRWIPLWGKLALELADHPIRKAIDFCGVEKLSKHVEIPGL